MQRLRFISWLLVTVLLSPNITSFAADKKEKKSKKEDVEAIGSRKVARRSIISLEKEIAIGKQIATEIDRSAKILTDSVVSEYVNRVAQNIARNSDLTIPLTVKVIDSPEINAFALPGGFLYVNTGLLLAADEEAQIAGVIAHEVAHAAARHWASQMTKAQIASIAQIPIAILTGGLSYPVWAAVWQLYGVAVPLTFLKFSRGDEAEADMLGIQYLYKAGYDPEAYVTLFAKVIEQERRTPGSVPKIFMEHPPTAERILKAEQIIKELLPKKEQNLVSTSEFDDVKSRLQIVMSRLKSKEKEGKPTLRKREETGQTSEEKSKEQEEEKPPVLRRRD